MKSIYVLILMIFFAVTSKSYSQDTSDDALVKKLFGEEHFKQLDQRLEEMMRRMEESFGDDQSGQNSKFFKHSFGNSFQQNNFLQSEWQDDDKEARLILTFATRPDDKMVIKVENGRVVVEGKMIVEQKDESDNSKVYSRSESYLSQSYAIPDNVNEKKVKINAGENDKVMVFHFPKINSSNTKDLKNNNLAPVPPIPNAKTI